MTYRGFFDGGSRGNPGKAGAGALLLSDQNETIWEKALFLGKKTNNEAEYSALIILLEEIARRNLKTVEICGDSRLVIKQIRGEWKIHEPHLRKLADRARIHLAGRNIIFRWIPREQNKRADKLSNIAMDSGETERKTGKTPPAKNPVFPPEKLEPVGGDIYIAHGTEDYAVDVLHEACTCPAFRRNKKCKHLEAARTLNAKER